MVLMRRGRQSEAEGMQCIAPSMLLAVMASCLCVNEQVACCKQKHEEQASSSPNSHIRVGVGVGAIASEWNACNRLLLALRHHTSA